jgi:hypothetical protein
MEMQHHGRPVELGFDLILNIGGGHEDTAEVAGTPQLLPPHIELTVVGGQPRSIELIVALPRTLFVRGADPFIPIRLSPALCESAM